MLDFTHAFSTAWERMVVILFRPFDVPKWCVIGFSAFLAGLLSGGNSINPPSGSNNQAQSNQHHAGLYHHPHGLYAQTGLPYPFNLNPSPQSLATWVTHLVATWQVGVILLFTAAVFVFVLGIIVLCYWLGARGQFLLLDNIVRNRGSIAEPWVFYAQRANRVFVFYLILMAAGFALAVVLIVPAMIWLPFWQQHHALQGAAWVPLIVIGLGLFYVVLFVVYLVALFIFRDWGIPLMFRNNVTVRAALAETWRLVCRRPGSVTLYLLLRIALFVALVLLSWAACCATCCGALLPYVGTVILLPPLVYIRCFSLDCLAQFGPEYDVFTADVPPATQAGAPSPLPPPG